MPLVARRRHDAFVGVVGHQDAREQSHGVRARRARARDRSTLGARLEDPVDLGGVALEVRVALLDRRTNSTTASATAVFSAP